MYHHELSCILRSRLEELGEAVMGSIRAYFNEATNEANSELYPSEGRKVCPRFFFKITAKGISYEFDHAGDRGSGAKTRHLAIFDVAMLRCAPLPFLIHDSSSIELVGYAPVRELLSVYIRAADLLSGAGEPK